MKLEGPKTLEDFEEVLTTILELQANPYCDHLMFASLSIKKKNTEEKIKQLKLKETNE